MFHSDSMLYVYSVRQIAESGENIIMMQGVKIVFRVGLALLRYCEDDLVKLPFEKLVHALRNFPEGALQPDTLLPLAYNIKVPMACHSLFLFICLFLISVP
jgi:hypothetical protein